MRLSNSNRPIVLKYASFQTVCGHQNYAFVEWLYFAQKCIKFHLQPSRFQKKLFPGRNAEPVYRGEERKEGEGIKWFLPLKEGDGRERTGRGERGGKGKGKGREEVRGILLQGLKGDIRPCWHMKQ